MTGYIITHPLHTSYHMLCQSLFVVGLHTFHNEALHEIAVLFVFEKNSAAVKVSLGKRPEALDGIEFT